MLDWVTLERNFQGLIHYYQGFASWYWTTYSSLKGPSQNSFDPSLTGSDGKLCIWKGWRSPWCRSFCSSEQPRPYVSVAWRPSPLHWPEISHQFRNCLAQKLWTSLSSLQEIWSHSSSSHLSETWTLSSSWFQIQETLTLSSSLFQSHWTWMFFSSCQ